MNTAENKALVRRLVADGVNEHNLAVLDEVATGAIAEAARRWIGPFRESFPTGRRFEGVDEIYILRVEDGRLAEATAVVEDNLTRMRQLGFEL
jgi:hypothetical protein